MHFGILSRHENVSGSKPFGSFRGNQNVHLKFLNQNKLQFRLHCVRGPTDTIGVTWLWRAAALPPHPPVATCLQRKQTDDIVTLGWRHAAGIWRQTHTAVVLWWHTSTAYPLHTRCCRSPPPPSEYTRITVTRQDKTNKNSLHICSWIAE